MILPETPRFFQGHPPRKPRRPRTPTSPPTMNLIKRLDHVFGIYQNNNKQATDFGLDERIARLVCWSNADKIKDARRRPRLFHCSNPPEIPSTGPPHWSSGMRRAPPVGPRPHTPRTALFVRCMLPIRHKTRCVSLQKHWPPLGRLFILAVSFDAPPRAAIAVIKTASPTWCRWPET